MKENFLHGKVIEQISGTSTYKADGYQVELINMLGQVEESGEKVTLTKYGIYFVRAVDRNGTPVEVRKVVK
jgi:hypothetical protein